VIKWPVKVKLYIHFLNVITSFSKSKKHDFLRFLSCCTRFLEHCCVSVTRW